MITTMKQPKILAFGGSLRTGSFNQKAVIFAAAGARDAGADVTIIALRDYPLPLFDEDLEAAHGMPDNARKLKELFLAHDAFLIASPEYNSSTSAALKNAIDWVSRSTSQDEPFLAAFTGKKAAIMAASPGSYGGARGLSALRPLLENIKVSVIEEQVTIPEAHNVINDDGSFAIEEIEERVRGLGAALVVAMAE